MSDGGAIRSARGLLLRSTAWAKQQKSRVGVIQLARVSTKTLDDWYAASRLLPPRVIALKPKKGEEQASWVKPSGLRAFIGDNIASGRRWYDGFSTARHPTDRDRFLHYLYEKDNRGALWSTELEGLSAMMEDLDEAEHTLVASVHTALRNRRGQIASENQGNSRAAFNRMDREMERWRLAFSGAKTQSQVRAALADLWSRAGNVTELKESWPSVLPLLREPHWRAARDLALLALASYPKGRSSGDVDHSEETP